ncbi:excinuclease ABC subunit UvrC [Plantibacter sp. VKM Ac-2885]|nr:excinuclease ABC subunit UvrC [Plantibacter sp. CFBP 8775]MBD8515500.1 excinuclease ABC subunit UvrC [Plantibacter sp. CFBP 8804]MBD8534456.1 excinuclease ABC subunit UvrC [Plantibacter sp. CFBP 13570]MBF4513084.1 excinuclease ABC subunit UvrC [Plantibacter sp. VKM Ac-2885]NUJ86538.1 excinuclease ABC subunit UvrC [Plantibacter sp. MCCC 1A11337]OAN27101.1 excinuclease ABC subunit C [Plantibacter sp. H53]OII42555.1 excinuclease ABC subunit C [Plantibacter sp. MMLR14_011]
MPGVYRFSDDSGRVLYVGKAMNLRARLSNYFAPLHTLHERTRRMVTTATGVTWTTVGSDVEALQLEYTWIKEYDPPFNVKFRDDKSYPYLAVTLGDEAPRVMVTRNTRIPGAKYFGPYPKIWAVHDTVDLMIKVFPIRTCSDSAYKRAMASGKPCFPGQIGRCGGPCSGKVTIEEHRAIVDDFVSFMVGNDRRFTTRITADMKAAAARQDYESAAVYRDQLQALDQVLAKSAVVLRDAVDADLFGIDHDELAASVQQFIVRGGRIRGVRSWTVDKELDMSTAELVDSVVQRVYAAASGTEVPREVLVPELPDDAESLEDWLAERRGSKVALRVAQRGEKATLMETAVVNAKQALMLYKTRRSSDFVARTQALEDIRDALGMPEAPLRIECFDVSHLSGTNIVASMVVFEDGLSRKDEYRRFGVAESTDDTDSIYQVVSRRLAHLTSSEPVETVDETTGERKRRKFTYPPQLLIVDGGQPQVAAAARALEESGLTGITLCGLAKRLEEIWLPEDPYPVILPRGSEALFLLQRVRDEAHRFAISFQRQKRKRDISTVLGEIPGLGPAKVRELLKHFGSVARLKTATPAEITEVKGIGDKLAATVHEALTSGSAQPSQASRNG